MQTRVYGQQRGDCTIVDQYSESEYSDSEYSLSIVKVSASIKSSEKQRKNGFSESRKDIQV